VVWVGVIKITIMNILTEELKRMKTLMEGVPREDMKEVTVLYRDGECCLEELLLYIGKNGNTGHSFSIVVDPDGDENERKEFYWDGDGADYMHEVKVNGKKYTGKN